MGETCGRIGRVSGSLGTGSILYCAGSYKLYTDIFSAKNRLVGRGNASKATFPMVRKQVQEMLAGYVEHPMLEGDISNYIIMPELGENPGIMGAFGLGLHELYM